MAVGEGGGSVADQLISTACALGSTTIDLSRKNLTEIPKEVLDLQQLEVLFLRFMALNFVLVVCTFCLKFNLLELESVTYSSLRFLVNFTVPLLGGEFNFFRSRGVIPKAFEFKMAGLEEQSLVRNPERGWRTQVGLNCTLCGVLVVILILSKRWNREH